MPIHSIPPVFDENSDILILGSFPSVKSRESQFFYGHPKNRFWLVLSRILNEDFLVSVDEKINLLLKHKIALWDVIGECDIVGSSDSSVRNVVPNDIDVILSRANIRRIFVNGKCAEKYYNKYLLDKYGITCTTLPSTSPANAAFSLDRLCEKWSEILN